MWNTTPEYVEIKDDAKPVCSQPYPVPRLHEAMFRKEVEILVSLGCSKKRMTPNGEHLILNNQKQKQIVSDS